MYRLEHDRILKQAEERLKKYYLRGSMMQMRINDFRKDELEQLRVYYEPFGVFRFCDKNWNYAAYLDKGALSSDF